MKVYTQAEISSKLKDLPGWHLTDNTISRTFQFPEFMQGIQFVTQVAGAAEKADHHPDIDIRYRKVQMHLATHSEGGVTDNDFNLASQINAVADTMSK